KISSDSGPSNMSRVSRCRSASSISSKASRAGANASAKARPMPTACEPWPGKTNAVLMRRCPCPLGKAASHSRGGQPVKVTDNPTGSGGVAYIGVKVEQPMGEGAKVHTRDCTGHFASLSRKLACAHVPMRMRCSHDLAELHASFEGLFNIPEHTPTRPTMTMIRHSQACLLASPLALVPPPPPPHPLHLLTP